MIPLAQAVKDGLKVFMAFISQWVLGALVVVVLFASGLGVLVAQPPASPPASVHPSSTTVPSSTDAPWQRAVTRPYRKALPGYRFTFPQDHAAHPAFQTEWWYYTGHLTGPKGEPFGFELTFFRSGTGLEKLPAVPTTRWRVPELYVGHFALTDIAQRRFWVAEALGRPFPALAGAATDRYAVWIQDWQVQLDEKGRHVLQAQTPQFALALTLEESKPPALHGHNGVSQKAACHGCASHYYSLTRLKGRGQVTRQGQALPVVATAWMDHEFGSNQLTDAQQGWDWFSIQLDSGEELMLYVMRLKDGGLDPYSSGTWVNRDGTTQHLSLKDYRIEVLDTWTSPETGGVYPMGWRITLPQKALQLKVTPVFPQQELVLKDKTGVSYWEGASQVTGTQAGKPRTGQAYVELTGYDEAFRKRI